jgi:thiamine pyrophosphate-dependent acetolactate synthase large subunit-like protein
MLSSDPSCTVARQIISRLAELGVSHIFGYPGGQITPLYDAIYNQSAIRHVLARDEQAAGFMADGYARATGRPGVCLTVCGPGVLNAATPLATAFTDSVPMLLLTGQIPSRGAGPRSGFYHENQQAEACATFTKGRFRITSSDQVLGMVDQAFALASHGRPGPSFLEIPLDVLKGEMSSPTTTLFPFNATRLIPKQTYGSKMAELVARWKKPVILAGGGVLSAHATDALRMVARRLNAPVFHTLNGKSAFPADHPLNAGLPWTKATSDLVGMESFFSPLLAQADGMLAVGCRFTQAMTGNWTWPPPTSLLHIDVDAAELGRHYAPTVGVHADARLALEVLLEQLPQEPRVPWSKHQAVKAESSFHGLDLLGAMRRLLPRDAIVTADVTRLAYQMLAQFPIFVPRTFLHPAGYVSMGYALPAALGAKSAFPDRAVVAVVGDGGFLMSGMELASAVQEKLPIVVVLINDNCLSLIKSSQDRHYGGRHIGVDLKNPDFCAFAAAFGVRAWRVHNDAQFASALEEALNLNEPALVEVALSS